MDAFVPYLYRFMIVWSVMPIEEQDVVRLRSTTKRRGKGLGLPIDFLGQVEAVAGQDGQGQEVWGYFANNRAGGILEYGIKSSCFQERVFKLKQAGQMSGQIIRILTDHKEPRGFANKETYIFKEFFSIHKIGFIWVFSQSGQRRSSFILHSKCPP